MNSRYYLINFQHKNDARGKMCVGEFEKEIPFLVKRIFYQYDFAGDCSRGQHANRHSSFVFICLKGECIIFVDDGHVQDQFVLNDASKGLFLSNGIWKEMKSFSSDCILLVLSDNEYDSSEYIRNYDEYVDFVNNNEL